MHNYNEPKPRATLKEILKRMIEQAQEEQSKPVYRRLGKGLQVTITFEKRFFNLELKRDGVPPSRREWDTVLENWPYPTFGQCLADQTHKNILHGQVGIDRRLKLSFDVHSA